ncbi:MAG TPA: hypothetical protein ENK59_00515 [Thioploca sp.]|nr:hypothetical protein [Thioploca sp.]
MSISSPAINPSAVNLDVSSVEVNFSTNVFGVKSPPDFLTLEEVDENGSLIKTMGILNYDGNYLYSGTFTITGGVEGKKFYRATAIHNKKLVTSKIKFFTVTRFPIGPPPAESFANDYSMKSPDTGQLINLNKLTIYFLEGTTPERIEEIVAAENATILGSTPTLGAFYLHIQSDKTLQSLRDKLVAFKAYHEVRSFDISVQTSVSAYPDDPQSYLYADEFESYGLTAVELRPNLTTVRADETWLIAKGNVPITFIDTGIDSINGKDTNNLDLRDNVGERGWNIFSGSKDTTDGYSNGHGTHVAGVAAASTNNGIGISGIAWDSEIIPIVALQYDGSLLPEAITYAVDNNLDSKIINISGGVDFDDLNDLEFENLKTAVKYANDNDKLIIAAAHNRIKGYKDKNNVEYEDGKFRVGPNGVRFPCAYSINSENLGLEDLGVLCVGNSTINYKGDIRYPKENDSYNNPKDDNCYNTEADKRSCDSYFGDWVNIAAPGDHVMSTINDTAKRKYECLTNSTKDPRTCVCMVPQKQIDCFDGIIGPYCSLPSTKQITCLNTYKNGLFSENDELTLREGELEKLVTTEYNSEYYGILSGTSMSTPLVSGAAAILWSLHTDWKPNQIRERLLKTAEPLDPELKIGNRLDIFEAVFNGSFETGDLSEWEFTGTCGVIQSLGTKNPIKPTHRKYMAACSTGPGSDFVSASLRKTLTVQPGVTELPISMDYNFVSEEYPEYVGSIYDDTLKVKLINEGNVIFDEILASVNTSKFLLEVIYENLAPGGDETAGQTGWIHVGTVIPIPNNGGIYEIEISFDITDEGDDIYDSAMLIDHVQLEY